MLTGRSSATASANHSTSGSGSSAGSQTTTWSASSGAATSTAPRPPVPSSADAVFLQEEMSAFFSLTRDASPHGWAAVVRWWGEVDGRMALHGDGDSCW